MIIRVDDSLAIEVQFSEEDREDGYDDDIRFAFHQSGPQELWLLPADVTSILLTPEQAEQMAAALQQAADASRRTPR
jgi:hypothetical protein